MALTTNVPQESVARTGNNPEFADRSLTDRMVVFGNHLKNSFFVRSNGAYIHFLSGKYRTAVKGEIAELQAEVDSGHPHIFKDTEEEAAVAAGADMLAGLKAKIRAEVIEEQKQTMLAATSKDNNMGTSDQGRLNVQNSNDIAAAASGSTSGVGASVDGASPAATSVPAGAATATSLDSLKALVAARTNPAPSAT